MDYEKIYNKIIEHAKSENRFRCNDTYYEEHHILPKCLGGNNEKNNLVLLTGKEHYLCHKLLTYIYPKNRKIICAFHYMTFNKKKHYIRSGKDYEYARKLIKTIGLSEETKKKIGIKSSQRIVSEETKKKQRESAKNRPPISEETHKKLCESQKGENNGMYGKNQSKNSIYKMKLAKRGKNNPSYGTHWITNGNENKKIKNNELIPNEWKLGRMVNNVKIGKNSPAFDRHWIYKEELKKCKFIKKEELNYYVNNGWKKGRIIKWS